MKAKGLRSYNEVAIERLRADRALAVESLRVAMESLDDDENRAAALITLRAVAEACGGLTKIAKVAGIRRESLYRALSPKGNPTLKTLLAILHATGVKLSIEKGYDKDNTPQTV